MKRKEGAALRRCRDFGNPPVFRFPAHGCLTATAACNSGDDQSSSSVFPTIRAATSSPCGARNPQIAKIPILRKGMICAPRECRFEIAPPSFQDISPALALATCRTRQFQLSARSRQYGASCAPAPTARSVCVCWLSARTCCATPTFQLFRSWRGLPLETMNGAILRDDDGKAAASAMTSAFCSAWRPFPCLPFSPSRPPHVFHQCFSFHRAATCWLAAACYLHLTPQDCRPTRSAKTQIAQMTITSTVHHGSNA